MAPSLRLHTADIGALYEQYVDALLRVAAYQLAKFGAADLAYDVVDDVFTSLVANGVGDPVENWLVFLKTSVRNRAIDVGRHEAGHDHRATHVADQGVSKQSDDFEDLEHEIDFERMLPKVKEAIDGLSTTERDVIADLYFRGMKNKNVAAALGVTPGRITQIHNQALANIREALKRGGAL